MRSLKLVTALNIAFILGCVGAAPEETATDKPGGRDTEEPNETDPPEEDDDDDDGFTEDEGDCDDDDEDVHPDAEEVCDDGVDNDCNDGDIECPHGDTGTAYLTWTGDLTYDGSSVTVNYGLGALNLATNENVCWLTAEHSGSSRAPSGCPDCEYSFGTKVTDDSSGGDYCNAFTADTLFTEYSPSDMWFGSSAVTAWGWADNYTYSYGGTDYDLSEAVFMYYDDGGSTQEWILRHYNFADGGVYSVEGDKRSASWSTVISEEYYYYFYY